MDNSHHSERLDPTAYIRAYPEVRPKPTFQARLKFWRGFFAYAACLALVAVGCFKAVNLYASTLVAYNFDEYVITEAKSLKSSSPSVAALSLMAPQPPNDEPDAGLKELLNRWQLSNPDQKWSVVVQGLENDFRFAKLNSEQPFHSASLYKLLVMYPLLQRHSLAEMDTINLLGGSLSRCVNLMLRISDNPCGSAVGSYVGWAEADKGLKSLGLRQTKLNDAAGPQTVADDVAVFLKELYSGTKFGQQEREFILSVLRNQTWRKGIPAGCGCDAANKTGDLSFVRHDAGIIEYNGGAYVLAVMTDGASYSQIARLTAEIHRYMTKN